MENKQIDIYRVKLDKMKSEIAKTLPANITPDRFIRTAMTSLQLNPELMQCTQESIFSELLKCAKDGLIPDGKEAALLVYRGKGGAVASYQPMVWGIVKLARNSGQLLSLHPEIVWSSDEFNYYIDENGPHISHVPRLRGGRGEPELVYVVAKTKDAAYIEVMTKDEVMAAKAVSKSGDRGPWGGDFQLEMWKKTAIKRLAKRLPMGTDAEDVINRDNEPKDVTPAAGGNGAPRIIEAQSIVVKAREKQQVFNHAPGAANPPPAEVAPDRLTLTKMLQEGFKKLSMDPSAASEFIMEKTRKNTRDLSAEEMQTLYREHLMPMAQEIGVQL